MSSLVSIHKYRPEIDGLRAIAVVSVILYHAQMVFFGNDWFEGGYVGVDVFFVISGYLIAKIVFLELESTNDFSYLDFYERRARRILPVLFFVILCSFPFAWNNLLPSAYVEYAKSIITSVLFGSNFFFYLSTTEYGADSSLLKPFLHTWSLGVEEQFYLIFPVIAIAAYKHCKKHVLTVFFILSSLSLVFAEVTGSRNPDLNFYLPFSRFWELGVGVILAYRELYCKSRNNQFINKYMPSIGLLLIVFSIFYFDADTKHPSLITLIPVLGTALVISYSNENDLIGSILGFKPFVWIGLLSYSAYLWHFPVFAFSRLGGQDYTNFDKIIWILITFLLSVFTLFLIERPFRRNASIKMTFNVSLLGAFLIITVCSLVIMKSGFPTKERFGFDPELINTITPTYLFGDNGCEGSDILLYGESEFCKFGNTAKKDIDFILLGDSHAMHAQPLLAKVAYDNNLKGLFGGNSGCPPLLGVYPLRGTPHPTDWSKRCFNFNKNGFEIVKERNIKTVFLVARWDYYVDGSNIGALNNISDDSLNFGDILLTRKVFQQGIERTLSEYSNIDAKIIVLLQVPHQNVNVRRFMEQLISIPSITERQIFLDNGMKQGVSREMHEARQFISVSSWISAVEKSQYENIFIIDPTDNFCNEDFCPFITRSSAMYTDSDHASEHGILRLESKVLDFLNM